MKLSNIIYIYNSPREEYTVRVHGLPPFDESKSYRYYNKDVELEFLRGEDKLPLSATYKVFDTEKERLVLRSEIKNEANSTERKEIVFFYEDYIKFKVGDKVISAFLDDCFK